MQTNPGLVAWHQKPIISDIVTIGGDYDMCVRQVSLAGAKRCTKTDIVTTRALAARKQARQLVAPWWPGNFSVWRQQHRLLKHNCHWLPSAGCSDVQCQINRSHATPMCHCQLFSQGNFNILVNNYERNTSQFLGVYICTTWNVDVLVYNCVL